MITEINLHEKARELVSKMTLEEKAGLCSGKDCWHLKSIDRLGLEPVAVMDGPHGLRKQVGATDNLGIGDSIPAVCFPTASAAACSFDRDLVYSIGKAIGEECRKEDVSMILGPAVNQKRSPICGRNFEYYSEDPTLSGELAANMILGIKSTGTSCSLKHFAVNNQEKHRMTVNSVVDERTLRETYLKAFEIAVKKGKPTTVMCAYNRLNGEYCSENKKLLTDILRNGWGFKGAVVSDWGAVHDRVLGIKAGLDLEMPGNDGFNDAKVIEAVKSGKLSEAELDRTAVRITEFILRSMENRKKDFSCDLCEHHKLSIKAAEESAVLLKNEGGLLPANTKMSAAVIGAFAKTPRYQGAGSSKIHPIRVESPWNALQKIGIDAVYAPGYGLKKSNLSKKADDEEETRLIDEACKAAKGKDIVFIFAGLTEGYESEGFDRKNMELPEQHNRLIEKVSACNKNVVVILMGGAPVELPWIDKVKAVLLTYLGGEGVGIAAANLLMGKVVPCGKLAETWPWALSDTPCSLSYPDKGLNAEYRESIYLGYRYYEKAKRGVLFPFGHGLSYTKFVYSDLKLDRKSLTFGDELNIEFNITNIGKVTAKETALIFTSHKSDKVFLPEKELREFVKVEIEPGETRKVSVTLNSGDFGFYNTLINSWYAESGDYKILVGPSSANCPLFQTVKLISEEREEPDYRKIAPSYFNLADNGFKITTEEFEALYGKKLPIEKASKRPFGWENTLEDISQTFVGKLIVLYAKKVTKDASKAEEGQEGMLLSTIFEMPFFSMVAQGGGMMSEKMMAGILDLVNGHLIKGISKIIKS